MKKKFFAITKRMGAEVLSYKSFISKGMGGLQVFDVKVKFDGKILNFIDSYYHLSGDAHKVIKQFELELNKKQQSK